MVANRYTSYFKKTDLRLFSAMFLVVLIAYSSVCSFSILMELEAEKIEKLAEGEGDIDLEEKEKNSEVEEDPILYHKSSDFASSQDQFHNDQYTLQLSWYHLKIPTPPPDKL